MRAVCGIRVSISGKRLRNPVRHSGEHEMWVCVVQQDNIPHFHGQHASLERSQTRPPLPNSTHRCTNLPLRGTISSAPHEHQPLAGQKNTPSSPRSSSEYLSRGSSGSFTGILSSSWPLSWLFWPSKSSPYSTARCCSSTSMLVR